MEQMRLNFEAAEPTPAAVEPEEPAAPVQDATPKILSVSDINRAIKSQLEGKFRQVWIKGETLELQSPPLLGTFLLRVERRQGLDRLR